MNQHNNTIKTPSRDVLEGSPQNQVLFNHAEINFLHPTVFKDFFSLLMAEIYI